jgi:hypothetical protein
MSATWSRRTRHTLPVHRSGSTHASFANPGAPPRTPLSPPIKAMAGGKYPPLCHFFLPIEVSTTAACRRLAAVLPGHSTIPLVELLLTPSCFFCPRFRDHRARAPASTVHPVGDLHWRQWTLTPVLSFHLQHHRLPLPWPPHWWVPLSDFPLLDLRVAACS